MDSSKPGENRSLYLALTSGSNIPIISIHLETITHDSPEWPEWPEMARTFEMRLGKIQGTMKMRHPGSSLPKLLHVQDPSETVARFFKEKTWMEFSVPLFGCISFILKCKSSTSSKVLKKETTNPETFFWSSIRATRPVSLEFLALKGIRTIWKFTDNLD